MTESWTRTSSWSLYPVVWWIFQLDVRLYVQQPLTWILSTQQSAKTRKSIHELPVQITRDFHPGGICLPAPSQTTRCLSGKKQCFSEEASSDDIWKGRPQSQLKFRASNSNWSLCQGLISSITTAGFWCLDPPCHLVKTSANMGWSRNLQQTTVIVAFSGILSVIAFFTQLMGDSTWRGTVTEALTCLLALTSSACLLFSCLRCSCSWPLEIQVPHGGMWHTPAAPWPKDDGLPQILPSIALIFGEAEATGIWYNYNLLYIYMIYIYIHTYMIMADSTGSRPLRPI